MVEFVQTDARLSIARSQLLIIAIASSRWDWQIVEFDYTHAGHLIAISTRNLIREPREKVMKTISQLRFLYINNSEFRTYYTFRDNM